MKRQMLPVFDGWGEFLLVVTGIEQEISAACRIKCLFLKGKYAKMTEASQMDGGYTDKQHA